MLCPQKTLVRVTSTDGVPQAQKPLCKCTVCRHNDVLAGLPTDSWLVEGEVRVWVTGGRLRPCEAPLFMPLQMWTLICNRISRWCWLSVVERPEVISFLFVPPCAGPLSQAVPVLCSLIGVFSFARVLESSSSKLRVESFQIQKTPKFTFLLLAPPVETDAVAAGADMSDTTHTPSRTDQIEYFVCSDGGASET